MEALYAFAQALDEELSEFLALHASGDWGEVDEHDRLANEYAAESVLVMFYRELRSRTELR
jgi:hypothetical protein